MNYKIPLIILGIILIILGLESPMVLIFPLWIFTYIFKNKLTSLFNKVPKNYGFIVAGVIFGLLVETFAIIENLKIPEGERILLGQTPIQDLTYGLFYYFFVIIAWYILLKKINYSKKEVFFITGLYGILAEETGQVFLRIFTTGIVGPLYAILVMFVYGLFPLLAYMVTEKSFNKDRKPSKILYYPLAAFVLFLQWAVYGNFVLPLLINLFS